jgi:hypothetical protein
VTHAFGHRETCPAQGLCQKPGVNSANVLPCAVTTEVGTMPVGDDSDRMNRINLRVSLTVDGCRFYFYCRDVLRFTAVDLRPLSY